MCVVSAHWVTTGARVMTSAHPETIHDFLGFPRPLYAVQYSAPGAPEQAYTLAQNPEVVPDENWGLDHGAWSVLGHMYPKADVPRFQLSLDERRSFREHLELGREIEALREPGVLILGSGNIVHNLRQIDGNNPHGAYDWAAEFRCQGQGGGRSRGREGTGCARTMGHKSSGECAPDGGALSAAALLCGGSRRARRRV